MSDVPTPPSQHNFEAQYDAYDGSEMTAHYSLPSNPSVKWAPTGVPHTNFGGRAENFTFDRMDPFAGRDLVYRRYGQPESDQDDDDSGIGASASTQTPTATAGAAAGAAVPGPSTVLLEDGTRPVSNIHDYSTYTFRGESQPYNFPGETQSFNIYVGDLPPRIQIDERNIPPLRKATRYLPEHQIVGERVSVPPGFEQQRKVSVPPGFEQKFARQQEQVLFHARDLKSSSSEGKASSSATANPIGGQQKIDRKGKGKMVDEAALSTSVAGAYNQHKSDWKSKGKEVIFPKESLSSGSSGSSLEMTELKAGPPPKLSDHQAEQIQEAGPSELPYGHVETYTYVSVPILSAVVVN